MKMKLLVVVFAACASFACSPPKAASVSVPPVSADGFRAPFGLKWGMTCADIRAAGGWVEEYDCAIMLGHRRLTKGFSIFPHFDYDGKLQALQMHNRSILNGKPFIDGNGARWMARHMIAKLERIYGAPKVVNDGDIINGVWEFPGGEIILFAEVRGASAGLIRLDYRTRTFIEMEEFDGGVDGDL